MTRCGIEDARQNLDGRRFARSVWADESQTFACLHLERELMDAAMVRLLGAKEVPDCSPEAS